MDIVKFLSENLFSFILLIPELKQLIQDFTASQSSTSSWFIKNF